MVGSVLRQRRLAHGLSQAQLARRAGTTQAAISRIERGEVSPTFTTLRSLFDALGEVPVLSVRRAEGSHDGRHLADMAARSPEERLELAMSWNKLAGEIALAGRRAREGG
ncbi:hypothetical protein BH20ACT18_BH20ACT18_11300 [soil metagenome]